MPGTQGPLQNARGAFLHFCTWTPATARNAWSDRESASIADHKKSDIGGPGHQLDQQPPRRHTSVRDPDQRLPRHDAGMTNFNTKAGAQRNCAATTGPMAAITLHPLIRV